MEVDIAAIKRRLMVKYPLFGSIIANLKYKSTNEMPTAATDGENLYYNPEFVAKLSKDEQTLLFAHEVCHVAFDHIFRSEGKNPMLWNIATDSVINALLKQDKLKMIEGGVDIPEAVNYNAEQMYEKLLKEQEEKEQQEQQEQQEQSEDSQSQENDNSSSQEDSSQNSNDEKESSSKNGNNKPDNKEEKEKEEEINAGHDNHGLWKKAVENRNKQKENNGEGQENEQQEKKESIWDKIAKIFKKKSEEKKEEENNISKNPEIQKAIEEMAEAGETEIFNENTEKRDKQLKELKDTLIRETLKAGKLTNSVDRGVQSIGSATALIDWRKMLKEAIKMDCDWSYANATIEEGVVTPHLEDLPKPETEIVLDTSGSIDEQLLRNFLRECKSILKVSKLKVGCFDTKFYGFEEIRNELDIEKMRFKGGGGTDFDVAVNAFSRRVENKIIFTDGEADMPSKPLDAIWIVFGDQKIKPVGGRTIYVTPEQLRKLKYKRYEMDR